MTVDPTTWPWVVIAFTSGILMALGLALGLAPWKRRRGAPESKDVKYDNARRNMDAMVDSRPEQRR